MNTILEDFKKDRNTARKNKDNTLVSFYGFLVSEIEKVGKNNGQRETTEDETIKVLEKLVSAVTLTRDASTDETLITELNTQIEIMKAKIPQKMSEEDVTIFVKGLKEINPEINKGMIMKEIKASFGSKVDMKVVGNVADKILKGDA